MKYRIQIQQVFGGNWANIEEATKHAEWMECENIKPRSRKQAFAALEEKANTYSNGAPHRLVMIRPSGSWEVLEVITRGTAFFPEAITGSAMEGKTMKLGDRELFEAATAIEAPEFVRLVASRAGDNAADTVGWRNRFDSSNRLTREFIEAWYDSVIGILSDGPLPVIVEWFAERGCEA